MSHLGVYLIREPVLDAVTVINGGSGDKRAAELDDHVVIKEPSAFHVETIAVWLKYRSLCKLLDLERPGGKGQPVQGRLDERLVMFWDLLEYPIVGLIERLGHTAQLSVDHRGCQTLSHRVELAHGPSEPVVLSFRS